MIKFKIIDSKNYIYISEDVGRYGSHSLNDYLFDGIKADKTNKDGWYKLDRIPTEIKKKQPPRRENERYELKAGYTPSDIMPQTITKDQYNNDDFEEVIGLYSYKYDEVDDGFGVIEFEISNIYERKDFEFVPNKWDAKTDLLTQIEYDEVAYQDRPCTLDSSQMYKIIREHVKRNIDLSVAKITSDYDFHFEVTKQIGLAEPYSHMVDVNKSWINKRRKPKWVSEMVANKKTVILNLKDKSASQNYGDDCKLAPSITGENYEDLNNKVEKYLSELIEMINKKYCECPTCKGWGIVEA